MQGLLPFLILNGLLSKVPESEEKFNRERNHDRNDNGISNDWRYKLVNQAPNCRSKQNIWYDN